MNRYYTSTPLATYLASGMIYWVKDSILMKRSLCKTISYSNYMLKDLVDAIDMGHVRPLTNFEIIYYGLDNE